MPRPKRTDNAKKLGIYLPEKIHNYLDQRFHDPLTGKRKHGAISEYIEGLIFDDMNAYNKIHELAIASKKEAS